MTPTIAFNGSLILGMAKTISLSREDLKPTSSGFAKGSKALATRENAVKMIASSCGLVYILVSERDTREHQ